MTPANAVYVRELVLNPARLRTERLSHISSFAVVQVGSGSAPRRHDMTRVQSKLFSGVFQALGGPNRRKIGGLAGIPQPRFAPAEQNRHLLRSRDREGAVRPLSCKRPIMSGPPVTPLFA